jgi:hypothetical protein
MRALLPRPLPTVLAALGLAALAACGPDAAHATRGRSVKGLLPLASAKADQPLGILEGLLSVKTLEALRDRVPQGASRVSEDVSGLRDAASSRAGSSLAAPPRAVPPEALLGALPRSGTAAVLAVPVQHLRHMVSESGGVFVPSDAHLPALGDAQPFDAIEHGSAGPALVALSSPPAPQGAEPASVTAAPDAVWTFVLPLVPGDRGAAAMAAVRKVGALFGKPRAIRHHDVPYTVFDPGPEAADPSWGPAMVRLADVLVVTTTRARMEQVIETHADARAHPSILDDARCRSGLRGDGSPCHASLWVDLGALVRAPDAGGRGVGGILWRREEARSAGQPTGSDAGGGTRARLAALADLGDLAVRIQRRSDGLRVSVDLRLH